MKNNFFKSDWVLILIFSMLFIGDTLTALPLNTNFRFSLWAKALLSILFLINLFFNKQKVLRFLLISAMMLAIGMFFNFQNDILFKAAQYTEYYSGILFFAFIIVNKNEKLLLKILFFIFIIYAITILSAFIFELDYLKTYSGSSRFGYMPVFSSQNEFSFIMIAMIYFFYKRAILNKNWVNYFLFAFVFFTSLCIGTKVIYLFDLCFLAYLIYYHFGPKKLFYTFVLIGLFVVLFKKFWVDFLNSNFSVLMLVYKENGLINALSSLRFEYLTKRLSCQIENFNALNYFFGGTIEDCVVEMSFFDLFFFFGILGLIIYSYLFKKIVINNLDLVIFSKLIFSFVLILSFLAGYYFENFSSQVYLLGVFYVYHKKMLDPDLEKGETI